MSNNKLILRTLTSPWGAPFTDFTKNSVLTFQDLDNNQIYLKGEIIYSGETTNDSITLNKINGNNIHLNLSDISQPDWYFEDTFFVTPNGDDSTGEINNPNKPFLTIRGTRIAAENHASTGTSVDNLIYVCAGDYLGESELAYNGSYYFEPNTFVQTIETNQNNTKALFYASTTNIWGDVAKTGITCNVYGYAHFDVLSATDKMSDGWHQPMVEVSDTTSEINIECDKITGGIGRVVYLKNGGKLSVKCNSIIASDLDGPAYYTSTVHAVEGNFTINCPYIETNYPSSIGSCNTMTLSDGDNDTPLLTNILIGEINMKSTGIGFESAILVGRGRQWDYNNLDTRIVLNINKVTSTGYGVYFIDCIQGYYVINILNLVSDSFAINLQDRSNVGTNTVFKEFRGNFISNNEHAVYIYNRKDLTSYDFRGTYETKGVDKSAILINDTTSDDITINGKYTNTTGTEATINFLNSSVSGSFNFKTTYLFGESTNSISSVSLIRLNILDKLFIYNSTSGTILNNIELNGIYNVSDNTNKSLIYSDNISSNELKGIKYEEDYTTDWDGTTPDSMLITKGYSDRSVSGNSYFTSGSTGTGSIVSKPNLSSGGDATGDYSFSIGNETTASGVGSRSGGFGTSASGNNSVHEGVGYIVNTGSSITISDLQYFEFVRIDLNTMSNNYVEGQPLTPPVTVNGDTHIIIAGDVSFTGTSKFDLLEEFFMDDSQNSMAVNMRIKNPYDFSEIEITSSFDGINTTLVFSPKLEDVYYNIQYSNYLLDTGYGAIGNASTVLGSLNVSDSDNSFTFGNNCLNQSNNGFVGGEYARNSTESDNYNVDYSFAFGRSVQNNSRASVIIGEASSIRKNGGNNTLLGYNNNIGTRSGDNYNNTIIGDSSSIFGSSSRNILIGHQNIIFETYDYNYILGSQNKIINGSKNVVLGVDNDVDGGSINSFVLSQNSVITANNSIILGGYSINATSDNTAYVPNLNIDTTPQNDNVLTQILVRDNSTGDIKYKDVSSFTDLNVTGGTYDINTGVVTFTNNEGNTFDVGGFTSGMTDSFTTGATLNGNIIEFGSNLYGADFYNIDLTSIVSGNTFLNGLTTITGTTRLGGTLTQDTNIDGNNNSLTLSNNSFLLLDSNDNILIRANNSGNGGSIDIIAENSEITAEASNIDLAAATARLGEGVNIQLDSIGNTATLTNFGNTLVYFISDKHLFVDSLNASQNKGIYYPTDYTINWDGTTPDEIIPTKGYVDRAVTGGVTASNGLTEVGSDIQLGGMLTGDTNIQSNTEVFTITADNGSSDTQLYINSLEGIGLYANSPTAESRVEIGPGNLDIDITNIISLNVLNGGNLNTLIVQYHNYIHQIILKVL